FEAKGVTRIEEQRSKDVHLWRQGGINFITNYEKQSPAGHFCREHGPSACGMAFRVKDAKQAYERALELGAEAAETHVAPMELSIPAIRAIGGGSIFFVDRYGDDLSVYDIDFVYLDGVDRKPVGCGFNVVDHLTHNVYRGRMDYWAEYYERLFNFREIRFFDIKGEYTGLKSRALTAPDGKIRIPLNEEGDEGKGQIDEYLLEHRGEGIQHIAMSCDDLPACVDKLRANGVELMTAPPDTYYAMLDERLPGHGEDADALKARGILLDGTTENDQARLLLQIFGIPQIGPVFFEFIQRKGDDGFGEGNFKALFESIERDQISRGVLDVKADA
ncbi:MAG: 4-hydroxyphenylpyruvate dioxygenase, partial [Pseudomonadota bacterium]